MTRGLVGHACRFAWANPVEHCRMRTLRAKSLHMAAYHIPRAVTALRPKTKPGSALDRAKKGLTRTRHLCERTRMQGVLRRRGRVEGCQVCAYGLWLCEGKGGSPVSKDGREEVGRPRKSPTPQAPSPMAPNRFRGSTPAKFNRPGPCPDKGVSCVALY